MCHWPKRRKTFVGGQVWKVYYFFTLEEAHRSIFRIWTLRLRLVNCSGWDGREERCTTRADWGDRDASAGKMKNNFPLVVSPSFPLHLRWLNLEKLWTDIRIEPIFMLNIVNEQKFGMYVQEVTLSTVHGKNILDWVCTLMRSRVCAQTHTQTL